MNTQTQTNHGTSSQPEWAVRGHRAVPAINTPRLSTLDMDITTNLRPTVLLLIARPLLGFVAFCIVASQGWWAATPVLLWLLYGSACSATHHLIHGGLGLSPKARHFWLTTLGLLIAESGHAWQATHVMHHRDGTDLPDPEGYLEYLTWTQLPLGALKWRFRMMAWGYKFGARQTRTRHELITIAAAHLVALMLIPLTVLPIMYLALMQVGSFLFAVMLAKGPQTNFGREANAPLIMVTAKLTGLFLFNHHHHLEHHLYPKVPMARLGQLSTVIEDALDGADIHHVDLAV